MPTTQVHADLAETTSSRLDEQDLRIPDGVELHPALADTLRLRASRWLTRAQREFHDALFALDGSEDSLDRYASARAELDSAEAWALHVARALRGAAFAAPPSKAH
ncbi:MAG: FruA-associating protein, FapA [Hyalangium sp.]|uniref:FruA-associating protein, FapA n=1 Tax=Hyalangium sp. TaxID=2028555 RepID=UPI00389B34BD